MVSELLVEEARKSGVKIFEAASDTDLTNSDDPTRVMIRQMLGVLAQWEKNNLVRKLRAARERIRHEKGRCEGIMRWEDLNPENQKLANRLVQFRNEGHSFATIAKWMNGQKVPAVRGNKWSRSSVHAIYARVTSKPYQPSAIQLSKV
jgi:DNA invertase Pin-like site-specific DNA recombinase